MIDRLEGFIVKKLKKTIFTEQPKDIVWTSFEDGHV